MDKEKSLKPQYYTQIGTQGGIFSNTENKYFEAFLERIKDRTEQGPSDIIEHKEESQIDQVRRKLGALAVALWKNQFAYERDGEDKAIEKCTEEIMKIFEPEIDMDDAEATALPTPTTTEEIMNAFTGK